MAALDRAQSLVSDALDATDRLSVGALVRSAIRIARLRNDFDNLLWLSWEMESLTDATAEMTPQMKGISEELKAHYTTEELAALVHDSAGAYGHERSVRRFD